MKHLIKYFVIIVLILVLYSNIVYATENKILESENNTSVQNTNIVSNESRDENNIETIQNTNTEVNETKGENNIITMQNTNTEVNETKGENNRTTMQNTNTEVNETKGENNRATIQNTNTEVDETKGENNIITMQNTNTEVDETKGENNRATIQNTNTEVDETKGENNRATIQNTNTEVDETKGENNTANQNVQEENDSKKNNYQVKTQQNGIYKLAIGKDPNKVIEVKGSNIENNALLGIWQYGGALAQKFYLEYQEEGFYKITVMHTGKSLTSKDNIIKEKSEIVQFDYQGLDSQKWILRDSNKNGWIISPLSNIDLAISIENTIENGAKLVLNKTQDNDNQMLYMYNMSLNNKKKENGIYKLAIGKDSNKVIEVKGSNLENNALSGIWQYGGAVAQKFYLEYQEEGFYKITVMHTGKSLTSKDNIIKEKSEIVQFDYQGLDSQKWILRDSDKNGWIISPLSNPLLAISVENTIKNGAKLILNKTQDNDYQMLYMFNISKEEQTHKNGKYRLAIGKEASKVVEVGGSAKENDATLNIWEFGNALAQKFNLEYQNEGFYKITALHTGKSLTIKNCNIKENTPIVQYDYQGLDSQKWILRDSNKNGWIISPLSNPMLAISIENTIENGAKIVLNKTQDNDNQMFYIFKDDDLNIKEGVYGKSGLMYKNAGGQYLKYYQIGKGNKHLFLNFAIHGFEDSYYRDGQELTYIANEFFKYCKNNLPQDLAEKWTIFILPSANPDGEYNGWTKDGPGRTTLYSWAPEHKGIDMNRCFPIGYKSTKVARNYNGTEPFQSYEAEALRDFILKNIGTQNIIIDIHGWLNETMGDEDIGKYYREEYEIQKHIGVYGNGYLINWARSISNTRSMLLELPEVKSHNELINKKYVDRFNRATINLLKNF